MGTRGQKGLTSVPLGAMPGPLGVTSAELPPPSAPSGDSSAPPTGLGRPEVQVQVPAGSSSAPPSRLGRPEVQVQVPRWRPARAVAHSHRGPTPKEGVSLDQLPMEECEPRQDARQVGPCASEEGEFLWEKEEQARAE